MRAKPQDMPYDRERLHEIMETHDRRCKGKSRQRGGARCLQWASRGSDYCRFHGGHNVRRVRLRCTSSVRAHKLLTDLLGTGARSDRERLGLTQEVDASRATAAHALELMAMTQGESLDLQLRAASAAREALTAVASNVESLVQAHKDSSTVLDAEQLDFVVTQLARVLANRIKDGRTRNAVLRDIEKIRVPDKGALLKARTRVA